MKTIIFLFFYLLMTSCHSQNDIKIKYNFDRYDLLIGYCEYNSLIELYKDKILIFRNCGGDGDYEFIDTLKINDDDYPDFLFILRSDDYFTVYSLLSEENNKYSQVRYKDFSYGDIYCNVGSNHVKYIYLQDVDRKGKKEVLINVIVDKKSGKIIKTSCSDTLKL
ncbi:MAG: hypothetical protein BGP01_05955 [Paludibacter sp. 47-17]|nr:MAG: hypothetical protein ABS72_00620 [Paludibacter sp. SCN 50-10]OJX88871.1 MAG: hypothetical protein BGP01_05955 [Paludibacter sp. 47-17]